MNVRVVTPEQYRNDFPRTRNVYGASAFISVTRGGAEAVRHFVAYDEAMRPRMGIIAGYRQGEWYAPYSAPFTEIAYNKVEQLERIYDFISELTAYLEAPLHLTLAPDFYDPCMLPRLSGIFSNYADKKIWDFDYYFDLREGREYVELVDRAAHKNLARAQRSGYVFTKTSDIERAYRVISINRESHGYNLAMSLEQVKATVEAVKADFFLLSQGDTDVAAAMVYHAAERIAQVIYWGDVPGYSETRPMNLLPAHIYKYYMDNGFDIIDVGPSSTNGIPNSGLCRFKESIGCTLALKPSFVFR